MPPGLKPVRPNPRGGYQVASMPNANDGISMVGTDQRQGDPLGNASAMAYRNDRFNEMVDDMHNHPYTMPSLDNNMWGPFLQRLKENNVNKLAADPYSVGGAPQQGRAGEPSFSYFGNPFTNSSSAPPPGYTTNRALHELQNFKSGGGLPGFATTPGGSMAQTLPTTDNFVRNAMDALRGYKS